jgi:hypothetical protein
LSISGLALCAPIADIAADIRCLGSVPTTALSGCNNGCDLLDHLVGTGEQRGRNFEAEQSAPDRRRLGYRLNEAVIRAHPAKM